MKRREYTKLATVISHDQQSQIEKRGDLCDRMSSRENETRFLHQNEVNLPDRNRCQICTFSCKQ